MKNKTKLCSTGHDTGVKVKRAPRWPIRRMRTHSAMAPHEIETRQLAIERGRRKRDSRGGMMRLLQGFGIMDKLGALIGRGKAAAVFLLAAGLLCGASVLQAQSSGVSEGVNLDQLGLAQSQTPVLMGPTVRAMANAAFSAADAPAAVPAPSLIQAANEAPASITAEAGALVTVSAHADTNFGPSALLNFSAPLPIGTKSIGRLKGGLELLTAPGTPVENADPATVLAAQNYRSLAFHAGLARYVGAFGDMRLWLGCEAGFLTRTSTDPEPQNRVIHAWGCGLGLHDQKGNYLEAYGGRNQVADLNGPIAYDATLPPGDPRLNTFGGMQLTIRGEVAIPKMQGKVGAADMSGVVHGESVLNAILPSNPQMTRQDVNRIGLVMRVGWGDPEPTPAAARAPEVSKAPASAAYGPVSTARRI